MNEDGSERPEHCLGGQRPNEILLNEQRPIKPNEQQQTKIILAIMLGEPDWLFVNTKLPKINESSLYSSFLQLLAGGAWPLEKINELISHIKTPYMDKDTFAELSNKVLGNEQMRDVIAVLAGIGFNNRHKLTLQHLVTLLRERCPGPIEFERDVQGFLAQIKESNSPQMYNLYKETVRELALKLYGKRQEYYEQIRLLQEEADREHPELAEERRELEAQRRAAGGSRKPQGT